MAKLAQQHTLPSLREFSLLMKKAQHVDRREHGCATADVVENLQTKIKQSVSGISKRDR
jgi:hypothetical protein